MTLTSDCVPELSIISNISAPEAGHNQLQCHSYGGNSTTSTASSTERTNVQTSHSNLVSSAQQVAVRSSQ